MSSRPVVSFVSAPNPFVFGTGITPGSSGSNGARFIAGEPFTLSAPSVVPWYEPIREITLYRFESPRL